MTEPTVKIYSASFMARREVDGQPTIRVKPGLVIGFSEEEAYRDGMEGALVALPVSEGWADHQVILTEIPSSLTLGNYDVAWQAKKINP